MNKIFIGLLSLIIMSFSLVSCSDWTDDENVDIKQPTNAAYAKYLEKLRAYKETDHKYLYAWFDNSAKSPSSRGQHMADIPDSTDIVALMYPDALADFEIKDMKTLQADKGTKVVYTVSYDNIKKVYDQMVKDETAKDENYVAPEFIEYMKGKVTGLLDISTRYAYDGLIVSYSGQSTVYMTEQEKTTYIANQEAFLGQISTWYTNNKTKLLVFEGSPQFLKNKALLTSCKHIILNTLSVSSSQGLSVKVSEAMDKDVPTDRFIVATSTISLDTSDKLTGYYDTDRAITEAAYWVTEKEVEYNKAGMAIYNIQNDYYNISNVYQYSREAINIMNPAPTK